MEGAHPAVPPSTGHGVGGHTMAFLTHSLHGLLLLLQLPLQGGHFHLEVTCFYGSRDRVGEGGLSEALLGLASAFTPSIPCKVVAAIAVWKGSLDL